MSVWVVQVDAFTMKEFYDALAVSEKQRVDQLEYFDEFEEWSLTCYHYVIVLARSADISPLLENAIRLIKHPQQGSYIIFYFFYFLY